MGEIEDRLKTIDSGKSPEEKPKLKSELEKALEEEEAELAREMRVGRAEEIIAKRESRIRQIRDQLGKLGMTEEERTEQEKRKAEEERKEKAERIEQAKALYTSCIEAGGDPKRCADMVAGLIPTTVAAAAPPATSITELVQALKALDDLRGSDKGLAELKQSFDRLAEAVKGRTNQQPLDPIAFAKQQAESTAAYYETLKKIGMIKEPEVRTEGGKSLDVVKEENRHDEKMEEIKTDKAYKEKIADTIANIPEDIGKGIASHITSEGGSSGGGGGGELNYMICKDDEGGGCGTKIFFSPEATEITCPKCGIVYQRKETKTE